MPRRSDIDYSELQKMRREIADNRREIKDVLGRIGYIEELLGAISRGEYTREDAE